MWRTRIVALPFLLLAPALAHAQLSLYTAVDLARRNSASVHIAQADVAHATAALSEAKDAYLPSLVAGSSVGYTYGFPVGQPTVYNFQGQSLALSFSQPDYIRAARAALSSSQLALRDALQQVELDTSLDFLQLATDIQELAALDEQKSYLDRLTSILEQRVQAGVESRMAATQAELSGAQADLRRLDLEADADTLRARLAHLTGTSVLTVEPAPLALNKLTPPEEVLAQASGEPAGVLASDASALSHSFMARGDDHQIWRPQLAFGLNYSRFAEFNNYASYYKRFQHNNFDVGVQITLPIYDASRKARARQSTADALHAGAQAQQARFTADEQTVQLRHSLALLHARTRVAELQQQYAQEQLESVQTQEAQTPAGSTAATPVDEMQAHIQERQRFADVLLARFDVLKAQLSLLRATGTLHDWIEQSGH